MAQIDRIILHVTANDTGDVLAGGVDLNGNPVDDIAFAAGPLAERMWEFFTSGHNQLVLTIDDTTGEPTSLFWGV